MLKPPPITAVVLNWNKASESAACVSALANHQYDNLRIVVIDNGSQRGSLGPLHDLPCRFDLVQSAQNLGFCGGVNLGITHALSEGAAYVWLVNNDAKPEPDSLQAMLRQVEQDGSIGLASPLIRNGDAEGRVEFCGGLWSSGMFHTTDDIAVYERWSRTVPHQIWVVGTAVLIRRALVERIGLFDERFFAYWEDNDYSLRGIHAGYRNIVVPEAVVHHWSGTSQTDPSSKPPHYYYYMARNEILFLRKHMPFRRLCKPLWWAVDRQFIKLNKSNQVASVDALLIGLWDGLRGHGGSFDHTRRLSDKRRRLLISVIRMYCHRH